MALFHIKKTRDCTVMSTPLPGPDRAGCGSGRAAGAQPGLFRHRQKGRDADVIAAAFRKFSAKKSCLNPQWKQKNRRGQMTTAVWHPRRDSNALHSA